MAALEDLFRRNLPSDQEQLSLQQFRRLMPTKNVSKHKKNHIIDKKENKFTI